MMLCFISSNLIICIVGVKMCITSLAESVLAGKSGASEAEEGNKRTELLGNRDAKADASSKSSAGAADKAASSAGPQPREFSTAARGFVASAQHAARCMPR